MKSRLALTAAAILLAACARKEPEPAAVVEPPAIGVIERLDPALDAIVGPTARIEKIGSGFQFTEGPLYLPEGYLLFSDVQGNVIRKWTPDGGAVDFRRPSGYDGTDAPPGAFVGSNGLNVDKQGRIYICEHGNRRITRLDKDGKVEVVVDKYQGKRLNSPNDLVWKSDGALYFTDPPYGLPKGNDDPKKELKFNGIYRLAADGKLTLLNTEMTFPNGLAFSPDEKTLYVANSDSTKKIWMKFPVKPDGTLGKGEVFFDVTARTEPGAPDGLKVDTAGNLYCTGPGGVWIFSPAGKHLGSIKPPEVPANVGWGKHAKSNAEAPMGATESATTLYMTARTGLYRIPLKIAGTKP